MERPSEDLPDLHTQVQNLTGASPTGKSYSQSTSSSTAAQSPTNAATSGVAQNTLSASQSSSSGTTSTNTPPTIQAKVQPVSDVDFFSTLPGGLSVEFRAFDPEIVDEALEAIIAGKPNQSQKNVGIKLSQDKNRLINAINEHIDELKLNNPIFSRNLQALRKAENNLDNEEIEGGSQAILNKYKIEIESLKETLNKFPEMKILNELEKRRANLEKL